MSSGGPSRGSTEFPGPRSHRGPSRLQPLADPAGGPRRPPVHRPGVRDERLQDGTRRALRHEPDRDRHHLLDRDRHARRLARPVRHLGDRNGPRAAMFTSAVFWVAGFLVGGLGIETRQLWLLYLGYVGLGGIGLGIGYISPVSTLIKCFPDRPGLATGMAIMGFGGGALIASPLSRQLMNSYDPTYDG